MIGAQTRRAVVARPGGKRGAVEGIHLRAGLGREGDVGVAADGLCIHQPQDGAIFRPSEPDHPRAGLGVLGTRPELHEQPQRRQRRLVDRQGPVEVGHADVEMVDDDGREVGHVGALSFGPPIIARMVP